MNSLKYISDKFNLADGESSPIALSCKRFNMLPRLFRELCFKLGVEIGVYKGYNARRICKGAPGLKLYCVDSWEERDGGTRKEGFEVMERIFRQTRDRLAPYPNCQLIRGCSMDGVKSFEDESLDFVYIDATHDYESVMEDIVGWSKKVRRDGLVMGHDYRYWWKTNLETLNGDNFRVKEAVDDWVKQEKIAPLFYTASDHLPSWFYVK